MDLWTICLLTVVAGGAFAAPCTGEGRGFGTAKHVLLVGVDGFGGLYLENATSFLPNFNRFYKEGTTSTRMRNQMPTVSAPNWSTTICGMAPEDSGVFDNSWVPADDGLSDVTVEQMPPMSGAGRIPETQWRALHNQDPTAKIAVSISWDWINYLIEPDVVTHSFRGKENDTAVGEAMNKFISDKPSLMFVHFDSVDEAGHAHGWGSSAYYDAVKAVDALLGGFFSALEANDMLEDTLFMVTADHGGWKLGHGLNNAACFYIPALFRGPGVTKSGSIESYTTNRDFSATALYALGMQQGPFFQGKPVLDIYQ